MWTMKSYKGYVTYITRRFTWTEKRSGNRCENMAPTLKRQPTLYDTTAVGNKPLKQYKLCLWPEQGSKDTLGAHGGYGCHARDWSNHVIHVVWSRLHNMLYNIW